MLKRLVAAVLVLALIVGGAAFVWKWIICYRWCPYGYSLRVTRKTGPAMPKGQYADEAHKGVQEQLLGPGRYLDINPWHYSAQETPNIVIPPGHICIVKNNVGDDLPEGRFLAGPNEKGTQKQVLTPGVWRINDYGQEVGKSEPATMIRPGYVGVQTMREGEQKGVLPTVLQAGYYNINPREIRVDPIEVGYRVWEITIEYDTSRPTGAKGATAPRIKQGSGVSFPLADGKQMYLDFTVVWGIFPEDAPRIVREYGTVEMVEKKIIEPQVLSICKNAGSNLTTQEFIEGATREEFQRKVTEELRRKGEEKGIRFLIALVRGFHPAEDIKTTIQARMLAEEERETLRIEQQRDSIAAELKEAEKRVDIASKDFDAETMALVQEEMERGKKRAAETRAEADRNVAQLQRETAEINARIVKIIGQADADVIEAKKKAEAKQLELLIKAYGNASIYNLATFAESLPPNLSIEYRYAGPGTFWTETQNQLRDLAAKKVLEQGAAKE
ncbi:MAG: hypothetical protein JXL80_06990 [Planctomycetes bacterium]|nr:hypothetical protein [Planctomycetota bacterium]